MSNKKNKKKNTSPTMPKVAKEFRMYLFDCVVGLCKAFENSMLNSVCDYEIEVKKSLNGIHLCLLNEDFDGLRKIFSVDDNYFTNFTDYIVVLMGALAGLEEVKKRFIDNIIDSYGGIYKKCMKIYISDNREIMNVKNIFIQQVFEDGYNRYSSLILNPYHDLYSQVNDSILSELCYIYCNLILNHIDEIDFKLNRDKISYDDIIWFTEFLFNYDSSSLELFLNKLKESNVDYSINEEFKTDNKTSYKYIDSWVELSTLANKKGFTLERSNGDHGVFIHNTTNKIVVIPQGRSIGKGLSIKIQKRIDEYSI